jgi:hypothetical protein
MKTINFKGDKLSKRIVVKRLKMWAHNDYGKSWYVDANDFAIHLSAKYNTPLLNVCGLISSLSPQKSWEENKKQAERFLSTGDTNNQTNANKAKAHKIMLATSKEEIVAILNGNKTQRFFLNILLPNEIYGVTIDRHAIAAAIQNNNNVRPLDKKLAILTDNQYSFFEQCYEYAALKLNLLPHELQAIVWENYRIARGIKFKPYES